MTTRGLLAALRTDRASMTAPGSARLTGGGGQHDTCLMEMTRLDGIRWGTNLTMKDKTIAEHKHKEAINKDIDNTTIQTNWVKW